MVEILTPRLVLDLNETHVSGIACNHAGPTSHAAILCRAFGIPAVEGIKDILQQLPEGVFVMVDGASGNIGASDQRKSLLPLFRSGHHAGSTSEISFDSRGLH